MNRLTIFFIVLVVLLFTGLFILIYPNIIVSRLSPREMASPTQTLARITVPKEIILAGSTLTIIGLVGLAILGFKIFKESEQEGIRK